MVSGVHRFTYEARVPAQHQIGGYISPAHRAAVYDRVINGPVLQRLVIGDILIDPMIKILGLLPVPQCLTGLHHIREPVLHLPVFRHRPVRILTGNVDGILPIFI